MMNELAANGRCCGRKPIYYKGGSYCSPPGSPMYFCDRCDREYGPEGQQRGNFAWDANGQPLISRREPKQHDL